MNRLVVVHLNHERRCAVVEQIEYPLEQQLFAVPNGIIEVLGKDRRFISTIPLGPRFDDGLVRAGSAPLPHGRLLTRAEAGIPESEEKRVASHIASVLSSAPDITVLGYWFTPAGD